MLICAPLCCRRIRCRRRWTRCCRRRREPRAEWPAQCGTTSACRRSGSEEVSRCTRGGRQQCLTGLVSYLVNATRFTGSILDVFPRCQRVSSRSALPAAGRGGRVRGAAPRVGHRRRHAGQAGPGAAHRLAGASIRLTARALCACSCQAMTWFAARIAGPASKACAAGGSDHRACSVREPQAQ